MSFVIGEFIVEKIIREQLEKLKNENLDIAFEDIFAEFYEDFLKYKYSKQIDILKDWITKAQINIYQGPPDEGEPKFPAICIVSLPAQEDPSKEFFADRTDEVEIISGEEGEESTFYQMKAIPINDTISIGVYAQGSFLQKLLFYIVEYIILKGRHQMLENNLDLPKISYSGFDQAEQFMPDKIFKRSIILNYLKYDSWKDSSEPWIDTVEVDLDCERQ